MFGMRIMQLVRWKGRSIYNILLITIEFSFQTIPEVIDKFWSQLIKTASRYFGGALSGSLRFSSLYCWKLKNYCSQPPLRWKPTMYAGWKFFKLFNLRNSIRECLLKGFLVCSCSFMVASGGAEEWMAKKRSVFVDISMEFQYRMLSLSSCSSLWKKKKRLTSW